MKTTLSNARLWLASMARSATMRWHISIVVGVLAAAVAGLATAASSQEVELQMLPKEAEEAIEKLLVDPVIFTLAVTSTGQVWVMPVDGVIGGVVTPPRPDQAWPTVRVRRIETISIIARTKGANSHDCVTYTKGGTTYEFCTAH